MLSCTRAIILEWDYVVFVLAKANLNRVPQVGNTSLLGIVVNGIGSLSLALMACPLGFFPLFLILQWSLVGLDPRSSLY